MISFTAVAVLVGFVSGEVDYLNGYVPATPECYLPLDVVFLQDTTQSFTDDLPNVVKQIPQMMSAITNAHPNSRFSVSEFKDKPFEPFGWPEDYCYRMAADLTSSAEAFAEAYAELYASGGDDLPESQYQACINVIQDPNTKWRNIGSGSDDVGAKVIIMSTDAVPHYDGDYSSGYQLSSWVPYPGHATDNLTYDCVNTRYPTYDQFAAAFANSPQTYLAILTPENDTSVVSTWQWINNDLLGQDPAFYQFISSDSSDFITGVLKALESVTKTACAVSTTVAPAESSTTAPTESSTTVPTEPSTTAPTESSTTVPTESSTTPPTESSTTVTTESSTTAPTESSTTVPTESSTTAPTESSTTIPVESSTTIPTESSVTAVITLPTVIPTTTTPPPPTTTGATTDGTGVPAGSTEAVVTSTTSHKHCPQPCPGPQPCGCDGVYLRVAGRPSKIDVDIQYKN